MDIRIADNDADIARCYRVMAQLRPHIKEEDFVSRVRHQIDRGYFLAFVEDGGEVRACAGYRFFDMLARGHFMYVDDLVTDESERSKGYGDAIFDWLVEECRRRNCEQLNLDSGVHRFAAHRFYFRKRMHVGAYNFSLPLN